MYSQTVRLNGFDMYYESEGSGEPLLLLHGGTGCHQDWSYAGHDQFVREYNLINPMRAATVAPPIRKLQSLTGNAP